MERNISSNIIRILKWLPSSFIFCTSWYLSSQETIEHFPSFWNADKLVHCICFAGFSFWVSFACAIKTRKNLCLPLFIVSAYGIIDEIHQSFTPGRSSSIFDWIADTLGALLGALSFLCLIGIIARVRGRNEDSGRGV